MKPFYTIALGILIVITLACGYSSKKTSGSMPAISQLSPSNANAGASSFMLTVDGSNFANMAVVNWNGTAQTTTFVTAGQLTIMVPAAAVANAGTVQVTVTNPGTSSGGIYGGGTPAQTSAPVMFTIN
jgi:hypothetical protein